MALDQATRVLNLNTPFGENVLLLSAFQGREELSGLFHFQLDMISDDNNLDAKQIVGQNVTFSVERADGSRRLFNGIVCSFWAGDEDFKGRRNYRAEVVPWTWFLSRTTDCRIFQQKTVPQIVEQIFGDLGFTDFDLSQIKGNHPERDYSVQYRESDFAYVCRLMEEEGIFFYYKHEEGKHTLVASDDKSGYFDCEESEVDFPRDAGSQALKDHITAWEHRFEFRTGKVAHTDYNFETPSTDLMSTEQSVMSIPGVDKYEFYDYPGMFGKTDDGASLAKIRMEAEEARHDVVEGESLCCTFLPGGRFTIGKHRHAAEEGKGYVITSVEHSAHESLGYETGAVEGVEYQNQFTCIPEDMIFRPSRKTERPMIRGPQTAVVVGPPGEEIYPDKYGRVKCQFPWDREGKFDENSSCWIRVSQVHAGKGFGGIDIPRIGEEVVISFLEGDPDRPIIIGRVYHAESMPPFDLPDSKSISGMKSNSTKGGNGYNEFIMDDTKEQEQIRIHAQYNMDTTVENNQTTTVHNNRIDAIDVDDSETVGSNQSISIGAAQSISVGADQSITVGGSRTDDVSGDQTTTVGSNDSLNVGANRNATVGGNDELGIAGTLKIGAGGAISISSDAKITLSVADSSITIEPGKITIGTGGKVVTQAGATIESSAPAITSQAAAKNEIMGGIVKIN